MSIKNWVIKSLVALGGLLPRYQGERFLVVSTTGLGDTLWATPAVRALRNKFPNGYIAILTSEVGSEVFGENPYADEIFVLESSLSFLKLFWTLRRRKIAEVFFFHASQRLVLPLCNLIGASHIVGTKGMSKGLDVLLTEAQEPKQLHEIERRLRIVKIETGDYSMDVGVDEEAAKQLIGELPSYIPLIGIHPGAKDRFKQWPATHFIEVGKRLKDHLGCQIVVTGTSAERGLVEKVVRGIEGAQAIFGQLSVKGLAALMRRMSVMISNDTGPMHLAFAVKTPVVALFSPTDYKICGPYFVSKTIVLQKPLTCTPCLKKRCREPFCMLQIGRDEVFEAALKLFYG